MKRHAIWIICGYVLIAVLLWWFAPRYAMTPSGHRIPAGNTGIVCLMTDNGPVSVNVMLDWPRLLLRGAIATAVAVVLYAVLRRRRAA